MSTSVNCPSCSEPLPKGVVSCPHCLLPLTGPIAVALWQTDQQLAALAQRRSQLLHLLATAAAGTATPQITDPRQDHSEPHASHPHPAGRPERRNWSGQLLLLGTGAVLLVTAAVVFLAVAWSALGVAGQVAVMGVVTTVCAAAAFAAARHRLRGTAQTLAVLTVALAVVDATAAYSLNLAGLNALNAAGYAGAVCASIAVAAAAAASHRSLLFTYQLSAVVFAAAAAPLALVALEPDPAAAAAVLLVVAGGFGATCRYLPARWSAVRLPVMLAAGGYLAACWTAALAGLVLDPVVGTGGAGGLVALAAAAGAIWVSRLHQGFVAARRHPVLAGAALPAIALTVVTAAWNRGESTLAVLLVGIVAAAVAVFLTWMRPPLRTSGVAVVAVTCHLILAFALMVGQLSSLDDVGTHTTVWAALTVAYAAATAAATVAALRYSRLRPYTVAYAVLLAQLAVVAAAYPSGPVASVVAASVVAVVLAAVAAWRRGHGEEWVLAGSWAVAVLTALSYAVNGPDQLVSQLVAGTLAAAGLSVLAYGLLPGRGYAAVGGVVLCSAATWTLLADRDVSIVEAYSLPLAALIAVVGVVRLYRDRQSPSWLTVGPALSASLLPSAVATVGDDHLLRTLLVLAGAAVVLVCGAMLRWQSPVVTGALTLVIVSVSQLGPYAVGLPRWLSFGVVGLTLLLLGARYEQRRRNAHQAVRWVASLR